MASPRRQVERLAFTPDDLGSIITWMERLAAAQDGWINLVPNLEDEEEKPLRLGAFAMFGGGASGLTMCTWIPGGLQHHRAAQPSLGITHNLARRVVAELQTGVAVIPDGWHVEQDHPRRGLILRIPNEEPHEKVLAWALRAVGALSIPRGPFRWQASIYTPTE